MAKKKKRKVAHRKSGRKGSASKDVPRHSLPAGFWTQVGAVGLLVLALLLGVAWFNTGGPVLEWLHRANVQAFGYAMYGVPLLVAYVGVAILRAEKNNIPFVVKLAAVLLVLWLAGLLGLIKQAPIAPAGGMTGEGVNAIMLSLVNPAVAIGIYSLLIVGTLMFIFQVTPAALGRAIGNLLKVDRTENERNAKLIKNSDSARGGSLSEMKGFELNAGVPVLTPSERASEKKRETKELQVNNNTQSSKASDQTALIIAGDPNWQAPSLDLLEKKENPADPGDAKHNAQIIKDTLSEFSIEVEMEGADVGPKVTQYRLRPPSGVKLTRISQLETNIALNLAARSLRIEAPIPGKKAVGIEVPNRKAADVRLRSILASHEWKSNQEPLNFAIGKDIAGLPVVGELNRMPHLLIAGQTNSGKSVMINTLLCSLLYSNSPSQMKLILVDPKQVEMARYQDIPHLLTPIITDPEKTVSALKWAVNEMERRYKLLAEVGELNIHDYNTSISSSRKKIPVQDENGHEQRVEESSMPYIVVVIDEMNDLMMVASRDVEALVVRLAQKARAVGIHLVLATQSPRADVVTGLIKANVPAKIAFTVGNQVESRIIMDQVGAEKLLGQGDMLYKTATMNKPIRVQGAWVTNNEVKKIADHLRMQSPPQYNEEVISQQVNLGGKGGAVFDAEASDDAMFNDAVKAVIDAGKASTSYLQRRLRIGYSRAARIMEEMEEKGIIGPADGSRPREILVSSLDEVNESSDDFA